MNPQIFAVLEQYEPLLRNGVLGAVLGWFMFRVDSRMGSIEHKIVGLNRTMLIEILSRPDVSIKAKREAERHLERLPQPR